MTHEEMLQALMVERFGTPGVLRAERPLTPSEEEWRRLKELWQAAADEKRRAAS